MSGLTKALRVSLDKFVRKAVLMQLILALLLAGLAGLAVVSKANKGSNPLVTRIDRTAPAQSRGAVKQRIEGEVIDLTPNGFYPKQTTRPRGPFVLVIQNESRLSAATVLLNGVGGVQLRSAVVPREKRTWSEIVDLPPGTYTLREAIHPGWTCTITIR